jgi:hypothetical protein
MLRLQQPECFTAIDDAEVYRLHLISHSEWLLHCNKLRRACEEFSVKFR